DQATARFLRSRSHFLPLKLRVAPASTAPAEVTGVEVGPDGIARFTLRAARPTRAEVCVTGGELVLPRCGLMRGMALATELAIEVDGLSWASDLAYDYCVRSFDFDEAGPVERCGWFDQDGRLGP